MRSVNAQTELPPLDPIFILFLTRRRSLEIVLTIGFRLSLALSFPPSCCFFSFLRVREAHNLGVLLVLF